MQGASQIPPRLSQWRVTSALHTHHIPVPPGRGSGRQTPDSEGRHRAQPTDGTPLTASKATPMSQNSEVTPAFHALLGHKTLEIRGPRREPEPLTACPPLPGEPRWFGAPAAFRAQGQAGEGSQGGTELTRDQRRRCSPGRRTALARRDPALPSPGRSAAAPGELATSSFCPERGRGAGVSPRSTPGGSHLPLLSTGPVPHREARCGNSPKTPGPVHRPAHSCRGRGRTNC